MKYVIIIAALLILWCLVVFSMITTSANAAGFDCNKARLPTEIAICQSTGWLGPLDSEMARFYYYLYDYGVPRQTRKRLAADQRLWLKFRNLCLYDQLCINDTYSARNRQLCNNWSNGTDRVCTKISGGEHE
jgi:uncharacterized protein